MKFNRLCRLSVVFMVIYQLLMPVNAHANFQLTEQSLGQLAGQSAPDLQQVEASFLAIQNEEQKLLDRFRPELFAGGSYAETNEQAIIQFQPIFTPIKQGRLGVRQAFQAGTQLQFTAATDQRSANSPFAGKFNNVTTNTFTLGVQFDLWKDVLGRLTKAQTESLSLQKKRAEAEREVNEKSFYLSLRRLYWSLVANEESLKITQKLLTTAKEQAADAKRRKEASVADDGEVARYEAQVASRQGNILYLEYQREILIKQMKQLVPKLVNEEVTLANYDLSATVGKVLACTGLIASQNKVPYDYTRYDEVVSLLREIKTKQLKVANSYDQIDVKLSGELRATGISSDKQGTQSYYKGSYGDAMDDIWATNRTGYQVGVDVVIPLGRGDTRKTSELLEEKRLGAQIDRTEANLESTHRQLVKSIQLLTDVIKTQRENSQALDRRLKVMNRKFREARVSVNDLIQDQDALMNSNLTVIQTQLEILNTLFDYLVVFTETPCEFNRI